jgi:hypothetical protein
VSHFRVPYPVGNTKTRDHIYWPIVAPDDPVVIGDAPDLLWTLPVTLDRILDWSWRVKTWEISGSFLYNAKNVFGYPYTLSQVFPAVEFSCLNNAPLDMQGLTYTEVIDEAHLLGPPLLDASVGNPGELHAFSVLDINAKNLRNAGFFKQEDQSGFVNPGQYGHLPPPFFTMADPLLVGSGPQDSFMDASLFNTVFNFSSVAFRVIYDPVTKLFRPLLNVAGQMRSFWKRQGDFGFTRTVVAFFHTYSANPTTPEFPKVVGSLVITDDLGSVSVPLHGFGFETVGNAQVSDTFVSGSIAMTMTAKKWWPYKTKSGAAVYDEFTGAQVNDPFS